MSAQIISIASTGAAKVTKAVAPRPYQFARYRRALTGAARRCVRVARIMAEVAGWMLFAGLAAMVIT